MSRLILCTVPLLVLAAPAGQGQQPSTQIYPLKIGSKWHYRSGEEKVIVEVAKAEVLEIIRDKKKGKEKVAGYALKITSAGRELTEQVAVLEGDGVYRLSVAGKEITPPLCILKFPIKKSWPVDSVCNDRPFKGVFTSDVVEIEVPAFPKRKFEAVMTSFKDPKMSIEHYFAAGIGIVKQRIEVGNHKVLLELEKYEERK